MRRLSTGLGYVILTASLLDVACMSAKGDGAADGGTRGTGVRDGSANDKEGTAAGGSAGSSSSSTATGGARTSTGGSTHSGGAGTASTSDSGSSRDSSTSGNSGASRDSGVTSDSGNLGAPHDSGTTSDANNVLIDPGFEEVTLEPWLSEGPDLVLEHVDPHSGNQHAALENAYTDPSPLDEKMTQGANLLAPGTYTFRIWIKNGGSGTLTALRVIAEGFNYMEPSESRELDILQDVTSTYRLFTLSGIPVTTAGPSVGHCTVAVAASGDENAKVFVDDASLTKEP